VSLIISASGQIKALTRSMPNRLAYWTTLRMIRARVWDEQALLNLMVEDLLHTLPPAKDGVLHLILDTTRKKKTGQKQPLAYTTKMGKFEPFLFGQSGLLMIAHWGGFRIPVAVRVIDPKIKGHQNILARQMLRRFRPPSWCQMVIVEADAGFAAKQTLKEILEIGFFYVFALPRTWKLSDGTYLSDLARHLPKKFYRRVASYKFDGRRRDYWTFRRSAKLSLLGDVTLVLSKRRFNDPPHKIKLLVTNLPEASTSEILSHFSRRWMVEGNQRWIEREGKRLTPCWSRRSNLNPAIAQTRFRGCARATRNCAGGIWYLTRGRGEIGSAIDIRHGRRRAGLLARWPVGCLRRQRTQWRGFDLESLHRGRPAAPVDD
jgi:hypothetical protein